MSRYTYLVKMLVCASMEDLNMLILSDEPDTPNSAEEIISISWESKNELYLVFWKERKWLE